MKMQGIDRFSEVAHRLAKLPPEKHEALLRRLVAEGFDVAKLPIVGGPRPSRLPLSHAQRQLWIVDRLRPGTALYNVPLALRLGGNLDVGAVERSIRILLARHEVLRTTFDETDGEPYQSIRAESDPSLDVTDLSGLPTGERDGRARQLAWEESKLPFDLRRGPLLRVRLLRLGSAEHWLLLTLHHIVADEWSAGVLLTDFARAYNAAKACQEPTFAELELQYADYALWQRRYLTDESLSRHLKYWEAKLGVEAYALRLPAEPSAAAEDIRGEGYRFELDGALAKALFDRARRLRMSPFVLVLAGFKLLLRGYTGQIDVRVGVPVANRNRPELEGLVGFFANTQVFRNSLAGGLKLSQFLKEVQQGAADAVLHQELPFERLVEALQPERAFGRTPLFNVMFSWHRGVESAVSLDGLEASSVPTEATVSRFDLTLHVTEASGGLKGHFVHRSGLFSPPAVAQMARRLSFVLEQIVGDRDPQISEIQWYDVDDVRCFAAEAAHEGSADSPPGIHCRIAASAERAPDKIAVRHEGQALSYAALSRHAAALARRLTDAGVKRGDCVLVCLPRSIELIVGMYAVLRCGAVYVPTEPGWPAARLREIAEDSAAKVVVTSGTRHGLDGLELIEVALDSSEPSQAGVPLAEVTSGDAAYVIYTSGSTGKPKGVAVTHGALENYVRGLQERLALPDDCSMALVSTPAADLGHTVLFGALCSGRTLHVISEARTLDPDAFGEYMKEHQVGALKIVPSHLQALLQARDSASVLPQCALIVGGEATSWELVERIRASSSCRIVDHYGPTETTVGVLTHEEPPEMSAGRSVSLPLGKPLPGSRVVIVDRDLRLVPPGIVGEICVGGAGVARGYLNRPDLTADRFIPDPFASSGERMYRTGDRAKYLADGSIEFLGRADGQHKIRGFRVEIGEIEARLRADPEADAAAVVVREVAGGEKALVAYFVPSPSVTANASGETPELSERLRERLLGLLPAYMVPAHFVQLQRLPVTSNGKLDRTALPEPVASHVATDSSSPSTASERALEEIWKQVLKLEVVGTRDNFFRLGGDSILVLQVVARARRAGLGLTPRQLFEHQTIAELATALDAGGQATSAATEIVAVPRGGSYPLSYAQQRQWFLWQLEPTSAAYHVSTVARLTGELNRGALERAVSGLVSRHESLRTRFVVTNGVPRQIVADDVHVPVRFIDVDRLGGESELDRACERIVQEEIATPFDLEEGPVVRVTIVRTGSAENILVVTMHHIASDGWSAGILLEEFVTLYGAYAHGSSPDLPELAVQYVDYASWQSKWLESGELERQLAYWRARLGGQPPLLELSCDRPRPPVQSYAGSSLSFDVGPELSSGLKALAQRHDTTLFTVILAVFNVLLHRLSGQNDIWIGVPIANRDRVEVERVVGFFVNTIVLRTRVQGGTPFEELLREVHRAVVEAQAHQHLPFERLVDELRPERTLSHSPLFQVMYSHQHRAVRRSMQLSGLELEGVPRSGRTTQFDLTLDTVEQDGHLSALFTYSLDLFDAQTIAGLARQFQALLRAVIAGPARRVGLLPLLDPADAAALLRLASAPDVELQRGKSASSVEAASPRAKSWIELFEAQVAAHPEAVVARAGDEVLTYESLDSRANRVGWALRRAGIGPDDLVAILAERSTALMAMIVGSFKAAAAYLPLDPRHPLERIREILRASRPKAVLVTRELESTLREAVADPDTGTVFTFESLSEGDLSETNLSLLTRSDNLAYVIPTSGSTGQPKGVMVQHGGMLNNQLSKVPYLGLSGDDVIAQTASQCFDISVWQLLLGPISGVCVDIVPDAIARDPLALLEYVAERGITVLETVPSLLATALSFPSALPQAARMRLRWVLPTGEACPAEVAERWFAKYPNVPLVNAYGPAECSDDVTLHTVREPLAVDTSYLPIGRPLEDMRVYITDENLGLVPLGVVGEVCIAGVGVGRGYWADPARTAAVFVPNCLGEVPGERLYRSGDRGRLRRDGVIEFVGRVDDQVKIHGHRIELGEIEARLLQDSELRQAVVVGRKDRSGAERLIAYVVPVVSLDGRRADPTRLAERLRLELARVLPGFMMPQSFVVLEALPLGENGKIDRKSLPEPPAGASSSEHVPPRTDMERVLAEVWSEVLQLDRLGIHDNFFELGGNSLLAVRVVQGVGQRCGMPVPLALAFQFQTLETLTEAILERRREDLMRTRVVLQAAGRGWPLYCIHPSGGHVLAYRPLAERFRGQRPVFGLQARSFCMEDWIDESVESMAEHYVEELLRAGQEEPLLMIGWSFGATLALEVARQWEARGAPIEFLGLIDPVGILHGDAVDSAERGSLAASVEGDLAKWIETSSLRAKWRKLLDGSNAAVRDWLASEFVRRRLSGKTLDYVSEAELFNAANCVYLRQHHEVRLPRVRPFLWWATGTLANELYASRRKAIEARLEPRASVVVEGNHDSIVTSAALLDSVSSEVRRAVFEAEEVRRVG